jgi:hypothetical protein
MFAVGGKPNEAYGAVGDFCFDVNFPYAFAEVAGVGMIDGVHGDSFRVVIDGNVDWPSKGLLDACARAASAGKIIDDDFFWCETYKGARSERVGGGCKHLAMPLEACNIDGAPSHYV